MTVKDKHEGFAEMRREFARTGEKVDRYAEQFRDDVKAKQRLASAFHDDAMAMRSAFERMTATVDTYVASFDEDVATKHNDVVAFRDEIEATRRAFEDALAEFARYAETFDRDVETRREDAAAFREEIAATRAALEDALAEFESYAEEFEGDVEAKRQGVEPFLRAIEEMSDRYELARRDLARSVSDFYGYDGDRSAGTTEPSDGTADSAEDEKTAAPEAGDEDVESIEDERVDPGGSGVDTGVDPDDAPDESSGTDEAPIALDGGGDSDAPENMVECRVCGEYYQAITESHLQTHDMSMASYKNEFGDDVSLYPGEE